MVVLTTLEKFVFLVIYKNNHRNVILKEWKNKICFVDNK